MKRSRDHAARVLSDAGWTAIEIAYALRWKIGHVERLFDRRPYISDTPSADAMGLELGIRAGKAIERLGVNNLDMLRANLHRLTGMRGVGVVTISEIEGEIARQQAGEK